MKKNYRRNYRNDHMNIRSLTATKPLDWDYMNETERYEYRKQMWHQARAVQIKRERMILTVIIAALMIIASIMICGMHSRISASESGSVKKCYANMTVEKGDTLWSIAKDHTNGSAKEIRTYINELRQINRIGVYESIRSGETLIIPVWVYES
ncbi:MAG: LysM peptidoglycan-binding domain-containing protein [Parasporobacterium sp.]|nr:LysM peptidoglycan-binding domain-containing protein [Parasporobacterium sp.]